MACVIITVKTVIAKSTINDTYCIIMTTITTIARLTTFCVITAIAAPLFCTHCEHHNYFFRHVIIMLIISTINLQRMNLVEYWLTRLVLPTSLIFGSWEMQTVWVMSRSVSYNHAFAIWRECWSGGYLYIHKDNVGRLALRPRIINQKNHLWINN